MCLPVQIDDLLTDVCCSVEAFDRVPVDSIMYSLTTHQARPCLSEDDLDGLNHLYPSCNHARLEDPICIKSSRNIGYARIGLCAADPSLLPAQPYTIPRLHHFTSLSSTVGSQEHPHPLHARFVPEPSALPVVIPSQFAQVAAEEMEASRQVRYRARCCRGLHAGKL